VKTKTKSATSKRGRPTGVATKRINTRFPKGLAEKIEYAAALRGLAVAAFIQEAVAERADRVIEATRIRKSSVFDRQAPQTEPEDASCSQARSQPCRYTLLSCWTPTMIEQDSAVVSNQWIAISKKPLVVIWRKE
jgi:hypothetical protein